MGARKKSGRLTLRMDPQTHARVDKAARALGMDINGLLNLLIRKNLPELEDLALIIGESGDTALLKRWQELNPDRSLYEFVTDMRDLRGWQKSVSFPDGKWYNLNAEANDFVESVPFWRLPQPQPQPQPPPPPETTEETQS